MLLPPQELIALGGIIKKIEGTTLSLIDCMAESLSTQETINTIKRISPNVIIAIHGFECFEEDMNELAHIKKTLPSAKIVLFGHYASLFPREILKQTAVDFVILGEPDLIVHNLMTTLVQHGNLLGVAGIAYRKGEDIIVQTGDDRIIHPETLPSPAYELLQHDKYYEPFMKGPFGLIQSARGCPYKCNYCVRSFGKRLTYRTAEQIIDEIVFLKKQFGINSLRFIDDTFTVHTRRVIEICKKMIELNLHIEWSCLSRVDTLKEEMIPWMKKAGCRRIDFGIESGSKKVLEYFDKSIDLDNALNILRFCKKNGIETLAFFIVGAPVEGWNDFEQSVEFAIKADFNYIIVGELKPYPGTLLFQKLQNEINFSILPYKNEWKDEAHKELNRKKERIFYRRFYFRKKYIMNNLIKALRNPVECIINACKLFSYIIVSPHKTRQDFV